MKSQIKIKNLKVNKSLFLIVIYLFAVIVLMGLLYAFPSASGALTSDVTLEYGSIEIKDDITCYIIRNENVYFSNAKGSVGYYVDEDTSVRKGTKIVDVKADSEIKVKNNTDNFKDTASKYLSGDNLLIEDEKALQSRINEMNIELGNTSDSNRQYELKKHIAQLNSAISVLSNSNKGADNTPAFQMGIVPDNYSTGFRGTVSYYLDGYEYALNPDIMTLLDKRKLERIRFNTTNVCNGVADSGDPLFKVINNDEWYALAWIDPANIGKYVEGKKVKLQLPLGEISGIVSSVTENNKEVMVVIKFNCYYPEFGKLRKVESKVVTSDSEGLLIPNDCITSSGGAIGVYVKSVTGEYEFTPVKVNASDGNYSILIAGYYYESIGETESVKISTVDVYDEVKRNVSN